MLLEWARVVAVEREMVWVVPEPVIDCASCLSNGGCGLSLFAGLRRQRPVAVVAVAGLPVVVNDRVVVGIPHGQLLTGVCHTLILPLLAMLVAALVAELWLGWSEAWVAFAASLGLSGGFGWARLHGAGNPRQPVLLRCPSKPVN